MKRIFVFFSLILPLGLLAGGTAPPIVGAWDCVATAARGTQTFWILSVKEDSGKLAATLRERSGDTVIPVLEPQFTSGTLTFKIRVNATEVVEIALRLAGDRLDGTYSGTDSGNGTVKGTRVAEPSGSGK